MGLTKWHQQQQWRLKSSDADSTSSLCFLLLAVLCWSESSDNSVALKSKPEGNLPKSFKISMLNFSWSSALCGRDDNGRKTSFCSITFCSAFCKILHVLAPRIWFPTRTKLVSKNGPFFAFSVFSSFSLESSISFLGAGPTSSLLLPLPRLRPLPRPRPFGLISGAAGSGSFGTWPHGQEQGKSWEIDGWWMRVNSQCQFNSVSWDD